MPARGLRWRRATGRCEPWTPSVAALCHSTSHRRPVPPAAVQDGWPAAWGALVDRGTGGPSALLRAVRLYLAPAPIRCPPRALSMPRCQDALRVPSVRPGCIPPRASAPVRASRARRGRAGPRARPQPCEITLHVSVGVRSARCQLSARLPTHRAPLPSLLPARCGCCRHVHVHDAHAHMRIYTCTCTCTCIM